MDPIERTVRLNRVEGYCDLGMWEDAIGEMLSVEQESAPDLRSRELGVRSRLGSEDYRGALELCKSCIDAEPDRGAWFIHASYCLHELGETEAAREFLISGPSSLQTNPIFFYNLACYENQLGRPEEARMLLAKAVERDESLANQARLDPDLSGLF